MTTAILDLSDRRRWSVVALVMGFTALAQFNRVSISVAGSEVFIPRYNISETAMGSIYTAFLIIYTIGMVPSGWLIDRIGSSRVMVLLALSMGLLVALVAPLGWIGLTGAGLWWGLMLLRSITGLSSAPLHPGAAHIVSEIVPVRGRATANGLVTAGALVGISCCYPVFGKLIDLFQWPAAFLICGMTLVAYGLAWQWLAAPVLPHRPHSPPTPGSASTPSIDWDLLRRPHLWLVTLSYAAYGYFQYLFFYWMGYYFEKVLQVGTAESRQSTFIILMAQGVGMAAGGWSTDVLCRRFGSTLGRRLIVMTGMGLGALFALGAVFLETRQEVTVALALSMAALGICEGVFWTTATEGGGRSRGFAGAFMNAGGNVGGLFSPVLTPALAESIGWPGAITAACAVSGVGGLVWLFIRTPGERQETREATRVEA